MTFVQSKFIIQSYPVTADISYNSHMFACENLDECDFWLMKLPSLHTRDRATERNLSLVIVG